MSGRDASDWDGDDGEGVSPDLYYRAFQMMLRRSGRRVLPEIEAALLALPLDQRRLMFGSLARIAADFPEQEGWLPGSKIGEVCVIGQAIRYRRMAKGEALDAIMRDLAARTPDYDPEDDDGAYEAIEATATAAKEVGIPKTLARHLSEINDRGGIEETPEDRFDRVLADVRDLLRQSKTPLPFVSKRMSVSA